MTNPHWENLKEIFEAAIFLPPAERVEYLNRVCDGDGSLRQAVDSLIKSHEESVNFVDRPAYQAAAEMLVEGDCQPGQTIGDYRIVAKIGEGGMGRVYLAEDSKLNRKLSLKFLPGAFTDDRERLRRFEQEARAASALNHPNILTIYAVGETDGYRFIATEFIEGKTLREHLHSGLGIDNALDVAIQVASALVAAHRAGIVHRDIKPENIMVRAEDGLVKVLDFGLAKIGVRGPGDASKDSKFTTAITNTAPGLLIGTVAYMSPEQARGESVDERTDIWSLGVVLYEMVAGHAPFLGGTSKEILSQILSQDSAPSIGRGELPKRLEDVVQKAIAKNKEGRYQRAADFLDDLKKLRHSPNFQERLQQKTASKRWLSSTKDRQPETSAADGTADTSFRTRSVVHYAKHHKRVAMITLTLIALAASAIALRHLTRPTAAPILTDKDTLLVADFENRTGDEVFDHTLKQAFAIQLSQSPFLSIIPETTVRQTLKLMNRSPDERVFGDVAREICQRQGLKAFVTGSIALIGSHYALTLEAINGVSGETLTRTQVEAENKEEVLKIFAGATSDLREKLGESLKSIEKFDKALELTTSSLEALKAFSLARDQEIKGGYREAVPFLKHAVQLDQNFASAYVSLATNYSNSGQPTLAAASAARAYSLRDRVSERERLRIDSFYYSFVTHELDKFIETLEVWRHTYPREVNPALNLSAAYAWIGQPEKSAHAAREAMLLNPNTATSHFNLAFALTRLSRFDEARDLLQSALQKNFDNSDIRFFLYQIFFVRGDTAGMQQQLDWTKGRPDEYVRFHWEAHTASFAGRWREAQDFWRRSIDLAVQSDTKEVAAAFASEEAAEAAATGQCVDAKAAAMQFYKLAPDDSSQSRAALALAMCDEPVQALRFMAGPMKLYPKDTKLNGVWLPMVQATIELRRGNAQKALELLELPSRYEVEAEYWPQTLRGQAYLKLNRPNEAAVEFQKIIDNRGQGPIAELYPLAHFGLARAAGMAGDVEKSRRAYQEFLETWKDADANLPALIAARSEYDKISRTSH